jgi:4-oxalocrotonate tautomerase
MSPYTFHRRKGMAFIRIKVVEGVFTAQQKREIVEPLTQAMVAIEGPRGMRQLTWGVVEEIASGELGIGGRALTADDLKAFARGSEVEAATATLGAHEAPAALLHAC